MAVRLYYNAADSRARASTEWHDNWISKSGLKARSWTDKAISQFLGKPQKAGPIMAWTQKEVRRVENTHEFQQWLAKLREWLIAHGKLPADESIPSLLRMFAFKLSPLLGYPIKAKIPGNTV